MQYDSTTLKYLYRLQTAIVVMLIYDYTKFGQLSAKDCVNYKQCFNSLRTALVSGACFFVYFSIPGVWMSKLYRQEKFMYGQVEF